MNSSVTALLVSLIIIETLAQILLSKKNNTLATVAGVILYAIIGYLFKLLIDNSESLGVSNALWNAFSVLLGFVITGVILRDEVTTVQKWSAVPIIVGCLMLLIQ